VFDDAGNSQVGLAWARSTEQHVAGWPEIEWRKLAMQKVVV
jgi:hypothetical protein